MRFDELNENNYILFAIKHYYNPQASTKEDFYDDLKRFKLIKKLLKKYHSDNKLNIKLLINHFLILYNVFGEAATPLLFYNIDNNYWSLVKTTVVYLGRFPEYPKTQLHNIPLNIQFFKLLKEL
jgi:hypothetical protein